MIKDKALNKLSHSELKELECIKINGVAICGICGKMTNIIRMTDRIPICSMDCMGNRRDPQPFELWYDLDNKAVQIIGIAKCVNEEKLDGDPVFYADLNNDTIIIGVYRNSSNNLELHISEEIDKSYVIMQIIGSRLKGENKVSIKEISEFMGKDDRYEKYRYTLKNEWGN